MARKIENERQYAITKTWAERFEDQVVVLKSSNKQRKGIDPMLLKAEIEAMEWQANELRRQMREWENKIVL